MYFDQDGDLAHEFYEEVKKRNGSGSKMKRISSKHLIPQVSRPTRIGLLIEHFQKVEPPKKHGGIFGQKTPGVGIFFNKTLCARRVFKASFYPIRSHPFLWNSVLLKTFNEHTLSRERLNTNIPGCMLTSQSSCTKGNLRTLWGKSTLVTPHSHHTFCWRNQSSFCMLKILLHFQRNDTLAFNFIDLFRNSKGWKESEKVTSRIFKPLRLPNSWMESQVPAELWPHSRKSSAWLLTTS